MLTPQLGITVAKFVVTSSVSKVVKEIVRNNITEPENFVQTASFFVGTLAIGSIAGHVAGEVIDAQIKEAKDSLEKIQEKLAEEKKSKEETQ